MSRPYRFFAWAVLAAAATAQADIAERPDVAGFIRETALRRHLDAAELTALFRRADMQPKIVEAMDKPAESKPWPEYRKILLNEAHIVEGVEFWKRYRVWLEEAESRYGVAAEMIVAILGAESRYGQILGNYRVLDALSTLAFDYPRRGEYFRKELEEYLLLCKEQGLDPALVRGSYAGAMGMAQFMPSSFRQYAVDLDGDRKRNIWSNPGDAIASVAHYFAEAGWRKGAPVALPANIVGESFHGLLNQPAGIDYSIAQLRDFGVQASAFLPDGARARLISLNAGAEPEYWLALPNFFVITRYNHSPLYAMAAFQLGREILTRKGK